MCENLAVGPRVCFWRGPSSLHREAGAWAARGAQVFCSGEPWVSVLGVIAPGGGCTSAVATRLLGETIGPPGEEPGCRTVNRSGGNRLSGGSGGDLGKDSS